MVTFFQSVVSMVQTILVICYSSYLDGGSKGGICIFGCLASKGNGVSDEADEKNEMKLKAKGSAEGKSTEERNQTIRRIDRLCFSLNFVISLILFLWLSVEVFGEM